MTHRAEHKFSPIELATADVVGGLNAAIDAAYKKHLGLPASEGRSITLPEFRRLVALYLANQSDEQMCQKLGAPPPDTARRTA